MTYGEPTRTAPRRSPYGRRRALLAAAALLLAVTAFATARDLAGGGGSSGSLFDGGGALLDGQQPASRSTGGWPASGQGAYVLGNGRPAASPGQRPVPIASVAKVMTAYLILKHHSLRVGDSGPPFLVVGPDDVADTERRRREGQSTVVLRVGEQLTERDALMAILLPSANNVAVLAARRVAGSVDAFVAEMNATARALGMSHTTYTDPSGFDDGTVSTALDQLRLARVVARNPTLAAMMATRSYWLPVAGAVTNTNALLGRDGFVGMKTGSDAAAGGCLMFRVVWPTARGDVTLIGVVLGQRDGQLIKAGMAAAKQLADRLARGRSGP